MGCYAGVMIFVLMSLLDSIEVAHRRAQKEQRHAAAEKAAMRWIVIYCSMIWAAITFVVVSFIAQLFLAMECGIPCPVKCPLPWNAQNFNHHALYNLTL